MEFVCGECFNDQGMKDFCEAHATSKDCDFCGASSSELIATPFDDVMDHINRCVHRHFDDPANAGLGYDGREGGYLGITYDSWDVLGELELDFPKDRHDKLHDAVIAGLDNDLWCEVDPYALTESQQLKFSWENFCKTIKHKTRYFFFQEKKPPAGYQEREEIFSPAEVLRSLFRYAERADSFVKLPAGSRLYRARPLAAGECFETAGTLGPPPKAKMPNRMSPSGIVMTYVAENKETALAETANKPGMFAVGRFTNDRELLILDLANLPDIPTEFAEIEEGEFDPRSHLHFLAAIRREISRPIARDSDLHIEYVPTQVVTEYVRTAIQIKGRSVDGIRYRSSRHDASTALVLFADQDNVVFDDSERLEYYRTKGRWLRLVKASTVKVTSKDLKRWAPKPFYLRAVA